MNAPALLPTFVVLLLISLNASANAEEKTCEQEFNDMLITILPEYMEDDAVKREWKLSSLKSVDGRSAKLSFANAAHLLRGIEANFVEKLEKQCDSPEQSTHDWMLNFWSLRRNFSALIGVKLLPEHWELLVDKGWEVVAKRNTQLVQFLLSFAIQAGYTVGARALKEAETNEENKEIHLGRFVTVFTCLKKKIEAMGNSWQQEDVNSTYLSATFVANDEEKILDIKFDGNTRKGNRKQRQYNFDLISFLVKEFNWVTNLSAFTHAFANNWPRTEKYIFQRTYVSSMDRLLMAWAGVSDVSELSHNWAADENLLYLLKRFGHGLARRLLDSRELNAGYFQLHPQERVALEGYWNKLEADLIQHARPTNYFVVSTADNIEYARFHYEDAMRIYFNLYPDEVNLFTFNKRIQLYLTRFINDDTNDEKAKKALVKTKTTVAEILAFEMPVLKAAELIKKIEREFVIESSVKEHCDQSFYYIRCEEALARFHEKFQALTGGQMGVEEFRSHELFIKDNVQMLQLLLSFVIQMGYTLGSKALGLEDGRLYQLLMLHFRLENHFTHDRDDQFGKNSVYVEVQFLHTEGEESFDVKFERCSGNTSNFKMLNKMTKMQKQSAGRTIEILKLLDEQKPNKPFEIRSTILTYAQNVESLIEMWAEGDSMFRGNAAFYQLKRFGQDLGQRLLDAKEEEEFFKLFPNVKEKILKKLVDKLNKSMQECEENLLASNMAAESENTDYGPGPYKLLELEPGCDPGQIDSAFRKRTLEWHPDKHPAEMKKEATKRFLEVQEAYKFLKDEEARVQDNKIIISSYMHFEELVPMEFRLTSSLVEYVNDSVFNDVTGASYEVKDWPKKLKGMTKKTCAKIISDIFGREDYYFKSIYGVKVIRFDDTVASALDIFFSHDLAKRIYEQYKKWRREIEPLCVEFLANPEQKYLLVEQAKTVVDAILNLEMKAKKIVADNMGKQIVEQREKCEELEGKIEILKNDLDRVEHEHQQQEEDRKQLGNSDDTELEKKKLAEARVELVESEGKLKNAKIEMKKANAEFKKAEEKLKRAEETLENWEEKKEEWKLKNAYTELRDAEWKLMQTEKKLENSKNELKEANENLKNVKEELEKVKKTKKIVEGDHPAAGGGQ